MIPAILVILSAFIWLLIETDYMRVRLPMGKVADKNLPQTENIPVLPYKPSDFTPLDIPDTEGELNTVSIISLRGGTAR